MGVKYCSEHGPYLELFHAGCPVCFRRKTSGVNAVLCGGTSLHMTTAEIDAKLARISGGPGGKVATARQPDPGGTGPEITPKVVEDLRARSREGAKKYGEPLKAHNGRDALHDAYQEALDQVVYLRQEIEEREDTVVSLTSEGRDELSMLVLSLLHRTPRSRDDLEKANQIEDLLHPKAPEPGHTED